MLEAKSEIWFDSNVSLLNSQVYWRAGTCASLVCMMQVNPNAVFVNKRQEGNPVLKHIRNVRWQFADILPDYQMGQNACAVFLSLRSAPQAASCISQCL